MELVFMECVNQSLRVTLYPDEDMVTKINRDIGNARFTWYKLVENYQNTYKLFKIHGYSKLKWNMTTFNTMLTMLKKEHDFLYMSVSSILQQIFRNLISTYNKFFNGESNYPRFKSKNHDKKSFRIQNNDDIKIQDNAIIPKIQKKEWNEFVKILKYKVKIHGKIFRRILACKVRIFDFLKVDVVQKCLKIKVVQWLTILNIP